MDLRFFPMDRQICEIRMASCKVLHSITVTTSLDTSLPRLTFTFSLYRWLHHGRYRILLEGHFVTGPTGQYFYAPVSAGRYQDGILYFHYCHRYNMNILLRNSNILYRYIIISEGVSVYCNTGPEISIAISQITWALFPNCL